MLRRTIAFMGSPQTPRPSLLFDLPLCYNSRKANNSQQHKDNKANYTDFEIQFNHNLCIEKAPCIFCTVLYFFCLASLRFLACSANAFRSSSVGATQYRPSSTTSSSSSSFSMLSSFLFAISITHFKSVGFQQLMRCIFLDHEAQPADWCCSQFSDVVF